MSTSGFSGPSRPALLEGVRRARARLGLQGRKILVAVSGGADSVALLAALVELAGSAGLVVATIDHELRPGSREDCRYVARLCRRLGVPCVVRRVRVGGPGGVEAAARRARYRALEAIAIEQGCETIATAHTLEDQAETVLLRLARGAGTRGLRGILPRRGRVVRPMLEVSREDVRAYLAGRRLRPREDPTNRSSRFARNRVRARVLPEIERALGPGAVRSLARAAEAAREDERYLEARARRVAERILEPRAQGVELSVEAWVALHPALRRRVLRRAATGLGLPLEIGHVQAIERALSVGTPSRVGLPGGYEFAVAYGRARLGRPDGPVATFALRVPGPGRFAGEGFVVEVETPGRRARPAADAILLDPRGLALPLWLRSRRPGDRFRPARGLGDKKLKRFLIDAKVPRAERERLPLLCDDAGRVLWIVGHRASEAAEAGRRAARPWRIRVCASADSSRALDTGEAGTPGKNAGRRGPK